MRSIKHTLIHFVALVGLLVAFPTSANDDDPHRAVYASSLYPSATQCGECHPRIFAEWASSNHAYASVSPMFHKFEQKINDLTQGTIGTFCVRCHQQAGTQQGEKREAALWERSPVAREGITCITCHRVSKNYGKVNGERHIEPGTINNPVVGAGVATQLNEVVGNPDEYGVAPTPAQDGTLIHAGAIEFDQISESEFCVSCHQVAVNIGIKLEVVWDQYRASPALKAGITCQDCHMGKDPGEAHGYDTGPMAIVNGQVVGDENAKHSNHAFYGPGYPIAHPGIFPFNPRALDWGVEDWLEFDYRSDWGKAQFEAALARGKINAPKFPEAWDTAEKRQRGREIISQNQGLLEEKRKLRKELMENSSQLDGPFFSSPPKLDKDLAFHYRLTNLDAGHNLPSGSLGAQPEIWLNVALIDPDGKTVWESGYLDSAGDMADLHSQDVANGSIPHDDQLFNLQAKFLTTNIKGTDREMFLPVNMDIDQRPFLRPAGVPASVLNHPPGARMEHHSIPPLGYRDAKYRVPKALINKPGKWRMQARVRSRAEPIYFMRFVEATPDMEQAINEWMLDFNAYAVTFEVKAR